MNEMLITEKVDNIFDPSVMTFDERQKQLKEEARKEEEERKREKQSPYRRWTQFNLERTKELMWLGLNHPKARAILDFLVDQMDNYNAVMCSHQVLEELLGISKATVIRAIKILKDNKFIDVLKSGQSNVYVINDTVYWKSWGNNRKYSKFSGNIVLSLSEQDESYQPNFEHIQTERVKSISSKSNSQEESLENNNNAWNNSDENH
jgi:DNA-binding transcriptional ArsR family regulator